ncbi:U4/U6 small nuclear ribonucleoprotein PRP4, putative [Hepatocystis sp. ex Piliocolobus tephrosceles]|nr:U4/U6 small nuclear ribonucleoprotein PRP4, putative [Hepatocystis sp. ex Piliocolobus tephrosceles]
MNDFPIESKVSESLKLSRNSLVNNNNLSKDNRLKEFEINNKIRNVCLGIPTKDEDVKNVFRLLKEPICLFGEDSYDKRKRLKKVIVTKFDKLVANRKNDKDKISTNNDDKDEENKKEIEEFKKILIKYYIDLSKLYDSDLPDYLNINELQKELKNKHVHSDMISGVSIPIGEGTDGTYEKKKFYTESTEELKNARIEITLKTLPRIFLFKNMINKFQKKYTKAQYENSINIFNKYMKNELDLYILQIGDDRPLTMGKFSPDNSVFAVSSYNTYINIFNYQNNNYDVIKTLKNGHEDKINCIEWNYPNNYSYYSTTNYTDLNKSDLLLASCSSDKTFCIWRPFDSSDDSSSNTCTNDYENDKNGNAYSTSNNKENINDNIFAKRNQKVTKQYEHSHNSENSENIENIDNIDNIDNSGNSKNSDIEKKRKKLQTKKFLLGEKGGVNKNCDDNYLLCKIKAHYDKINKICFHPLNKYVMTCSDDETIKFFDIETEKELFYQEGHNAIVYSATFNPYGNLYVSGDFKGGLMLWDIRTGKNIEKKKKIHNNCIMNINFNPFMPNTFCTCSTDNTIKIFDLRNFSVTCNILAHNKIVTDAVFEPTYGRYLASSSFDTSIKIWDSVNFYCTKIIYNNDNKVRNVDISPNGQFLSSTSFDRTWKLYKNVNFVDDMFVL